MVLDTLIGAYGIMDLKVADDKLTANQLKVLVNVKKQKYDKSFSSLKKKKLLQLWKEWKPRFDESQVYNNAMVYSVAGAIVCTTVVAEVASEDEDIDKQININVECRVGLKNRLVQ